MRKHYYQLDYDLKTKANPGSHKMLVKVTKPKKSRWQKFRQYLSFFGTETRLQRKINANLISFSVFIDSFEKNVSYLRRKKVYDVTRSILSSDELHLSLLELESMLTKEKRINDYQITLIRKSIEAVLETLAEFAEHNKSKLEKELRFNLSYSLQVIEDLLPKIATSRQKKAYLVHLIGYCSKKLKI